MTNKQIIIISIGVSILFIAIGWILEPIITQYIVHRLTHMTTKEIVVQASTINQQWNNQFYTIVSFAIIPLLALTICIVSIRLKNIVISTWDYFFYSLIILIAFLLGATFKYYALEASVMNVLKHPITADVVTTLPLSQVQIYDWGFYAAILSSILIILKLVLKPKNIKR